MRRLELSLDALPLILLIVFIHVHLLDLLSLRLSILRDLINILQHGCIFGFLGRLTDLPTQILCLLKLVVMREPVGDHLQVVVFLIRLLVESVHEEAHSVLLVVHYLGDLLFLLQSSFQTGLRIREQFSENGRELVVYLI